MEQFNYMEDSFHVMSHEKMADVEGGLLFGLVVVGGVAIAGTIGCGRWCFRSPC